MASKQSASHEYRSFRAIAGAFLNRCIVMLLATCSLGWTGCESESSTTITKLPEPTDTRRVVEIDLGDLRDGTTSPQVPPLQALRIRANEKLRFKGSYTLVDDSDLPVTAYFHSTTSPNPESISQSASCEKLARDGDVVMFVIEIGSPTPEGGDFRLVLKAGGARILGTGHVTISP